MGLTDTEVAIAAAEAGAAVLRNMYGGPLSHFAKSPTDFATEADLESEEAIRSLISRERPDDAFIGEETGHTGESAHTWLVDPLCGTINFAAETPLFAVNVALRSGGRIVTAAIAEPSTGVIYGTDGNQAFVRDGLTDLPLIPDAGSTLVDLDLYYEDGVHTPLLSANLIRSTEFLARFGPRSVGSTLATTWVATGRRAAYLSEGPAYDSVHFAAPLAVCRDAGCVVTDLLGDEISPTSSGLIVAADAATHEALLGVVGEFRSANG